MRLIRLVFTYLAFLLASPFLLSHPKLRRGFRERLGWHPRTFPGRLKTPRIWLHGASAGDILALRPLAVELARQRPDCAIVASTVTNSGRTMAERQGTTFDALTYLPYDLPGAVRRTLSRVDPRVLVLEYTELWPELIYSASRRGVRVVLHNGRFAEERLRSYQRLFLLTGNLLKRLDLLLMRDEYEAERALRLGAHPERVHITGNTKFDNLLVDVPATKVAELRAAFAFAADVPLWVAGSTHEGEEEQLLAIYARQRAHHPGLKLVIAPRYLERVDRVLALAERAGLSARRRSATALPTDVIVLDTIGELVACYHLATLVFVGGSFVTRGGQNILEPAACGKPVLFGPHMENFTDAVLVLLGRGGIQVRSPEQLERVLSDLFARPAYRHELGQLARHQVMAVRGAAKRNAELVTGLL
jgi:3-deoxy-D-manno-octulosonic-acid transferase